MPIDFSSEFLIKHLITYIGNKRKLLPFISGEIDEITKSLRTKPSIFDGFAGSGVVSRLFKYHASKLYVNDIENYSETVNRCYLANRSEVDIDWIKEGIELLHNGKFSEDWPGFIERNYAPMDDIHIRKGERVFFTNENAVIIDNIRSDIKHYHEGDDHSPCDCHFFLAPLLVQASIHNNTSGVFKGFHKKDGIGHFGGKGENALKRIKGEIELEYPVFSEVECEVEIFKRDTNKLASEIEVDIAYYDPPYNQHPYGSNYFMLNIINDYNDPEIQNGVSGIIKDWYKSDYNKRNEAADALDKLIENTNAKYILLSYNSEGIIGFDTLRSILEKHGQVSLSEQDYNTYRGSRNLKGRSLKVKELLWKLKKS